MLGCPHLLAWWIGMQTNILDDHLTGVLLAGGSGSRMKPLTQHMNKHLIPVYMKPMIEYALGTLFHMGLRRILVITGRDHMGQIVQRLGSGADFGKDVDFTFKVQERAGGIAEALSLAQDFVGKRKVAVMLADNIFDDSSIFSVSREFAQSSKNYAVNFLEDAQDKDPRAYGVAHVHQGKIVKIVEKPKKPESNLIVTGLYLYPTCVFDKIKKLTPSERNELEITDVNNFYVDEENLHYHIVKNWFDAGEPEPWMKTQNYVMNHPNSFAEDRFLAKPNKE